MPLLDLHHVAVKTACLEDSLKFYTGLLGMEEVARPPRGFPGAWVKMGQTMIHFYSGEAARSESGDFAHGSAAIDHVALRATGFDELKNAVVASGYSWRQAEIAEASLWQLFIKDPNGITIELNFDSRTEAPGSRGPTQDNLYRAGQF